VAGKKTIRKKTQSRGSQAIVIFWLVFVIAVISVFMINASTIQKNFNLFMTRIKGPPVTDEIPLIPDEVPAEVVETPPVRETPPPVRETPPPTQPPRQTQPAAETPRPLTERPSTTTPDRPQSLPSQPPTVTPQPPPVQTRDRNIYFSQIDREGKILISRVGRKVPVSDTPMIDTLGVLLRGPSSDEINRGLLNLVPQNTRILSALCTCPQGLFPKLQQ
jgi:hypothetical protein